MTDLERLPGFDKLVSAVEEARGGTRLLEIGWRANKILDEALEAEGGKDDPDAKRIVYRKTLDELAAYFTTTVKAWEREEAAYARLQDYTRVTRYFTRTRYKALRGNPWINQLKACLVKCDRWWEYPEDEIAKRVAWCEANGWPAVATIREHFDSSLRNDEADDDPNWTAFDAARKAAFDKAQRYLDATAAASMHDKVVAERRAEARKIVEFYG